MTASRPSRRMVNVSDFRVSDERLLRQNRRLRRALELLADQERLQDLDRRQVYDLARKALKRAA